MRHPHGRRRLRSLTEVVDLIRDSPRSGLLVVDYWQLLQFAGTAMRAELSREGLVALKGAANERGVTVVVTSQLNRAWDDVDGLPDWCAVGDTAERLFAAREHEDCTEGR